MLTDAQGTKFEATIAAGRIRARTTSGRSRPSSVGSTMRENGTRSQPKLATGTMRTCGSADGPCAGCGTRFSLICRRKQGHCWPSPASMARSRAPNRRPRAHARANAAGRWVDFLLVAGQAHKLAPSLTLLKRLPEAPDWSLGRYGVRRARVPGGGTRDGCHPRPALAQECQGAAACPDDIDRYRNLIEPCWSRLKQRRAIAAALDTINCLSR